MVPYDPPKHESDRVIFAGNRLFQCRIRQRRDRFEQLLMGTLQSGEGLCPCLLGEFTHLREISLLWLLGSDPLEPTTENVLPSTDVYHEFPNAVRPGNRMLRRLIGHHIGQ